MGLPQVTSGGVADELATPLSTFVQTSVLNVNANNCDFVGMCGGNLGSRMQVESATSFGDFHRKMVAECQVTDALNNFKEGRSNVSWLKNSSTEDNGWFASRSAPGNQKPLPRIMGFESKSLPTPVDACNANQSLSTVVSITGNAAETTGSVVRKRLLSPLSGMLLSDQFDGDSLEIGAGNYLSSKDKKENYHLSVSQEHKKAHIVNSDFSTQICSTSSSPEWRNLSGYSCVEDSTFLTDGPVFGSNELQSHDQFVSQSARTYARETSKVTCAIAIPSKKLISPPLSLSPLGPKFSEKMNSAGRCRNVTKELDDNYITLKDMEQSLDGTFSGILYSQKNENCRMPSKSLEEFDYIQRKFDVSTPEMVSGGVGWHCEQDSDFNNQSPKMGRSFCGMPVRRSLIGSFEESLISGRLLSRNISKVRMTMLSYHDQVLLLQLSMVYEKIKQRPSANI